jgi:hypothetical protein
LTPYTFISGLQAIQRHRRFTHYTAHHYSCTRFLRFHYSYPGNGFITVSLSLQITYEIFLSESNSFSCHFFSIILDYHHQNSTHFLTTTNCSHGTSRYIALGRTHGKHHLLLSHIVLGMFTDLLPSSRHPIVAHVGSCRDVFTESLPSSGSIHHNIGL